MPAQNIKTSEPVPAIKGDQQKLSLEERMALLESAMKSMSYQFEKLTSIFNVHKIAGTSVYIDGCRD